MKAKVLSSITIAVILTMVLITPVFAAWYPRSITYNFNAQGGERALDIVWGGSPAKPNSFLTANDLSLEAGEATIAEVEYRCNEKIYDALREDIDWNQLDPEEEPYISDQLGYGEEIVWDGSKKILRTWKSYFRIHIYSLDNPETPESELNFTTRFYKTTAVPIGSTLDDIFPDGWWE